MSGQVRWIAQCCLKDRDYEDWRDRPDVIYSGWFYATGNDKPSPGLLEDFELVKQENDWLKWRLIQETTSFNREIIR